MLHISATQFQIFAYFTDLIRSLITDENCYESRETRKGTSADCKVYVGSYFGFSQPCIIL